MRYSIYIPLCLYFNSKFKFFLVCPRLFTFHYVSILILTKPFNNSRYILIYIPLCLYFNPSSPSLFIFFLFHPLSVDLSIAINILPYFSCFFYKIDVLFIVFFNRCQCTGIFTLLEVDIFYVTYLATK